MAAGLAYRAILVTYLADDLRLKVDKAVQKRLAVNAGRYPLELTAGLGTPYHELQEWYAVATHTTFVVSAA